MRSLAPFIADRAPAASVPSIHAFLLLSHFQLTPFAASQIHLLFPSADLSSALAGSSDLHCCFFHCQVLCCIREKHSGNADESRKCPVLPIGRTDGSLPCCAAELSSGLSASSRDLHSFPDHQSIASAEITSLRFLMNGQTDASMQAKRIVAVEIALNQVSIDGLLEWTAC
jgi:hypothetical protein